MRETLVHIGKEKMTLADAIKKGKVKSDKKKTVKDESKITTKG